MNIVIVDDHSLFRAGLTQVLKALDPHSSITDFFDVSSAIQDCDDCVKFDLVLLDYHLPNSTAQQNVHAVREHFVNASIVIVSAETDPRKIVEAINFGAAGYIPKSANPDVLAMALEIVMAGGTYLPSEVAAFYQELASTKTEKDNPLIELSPRQKDVLNLAITGYSNQTIADRLDISVDTVKAHLSAAYRIIGVHSRTQAVLVCHQLGGLG